MPRTKAGFRAVGLNGGLCIRELAANAMDVAVKAPLYHVPIRLVAVHGDIHPSAAGSDFSGERIVIQLRQGLLQLLYIAKSRSSRDIPPIQKNVAEDPLHPILLRLPEHGQQMADMRMDIAVG